MEALFTTAAPAAALVAGFAVPLAAEPAVAFPLAHVALAAAAAAYAKATVVEPLLRGTSLGASALCALGALYTALLLKGKRPRDMRPRQLAVACVLLGGGWLVAAPGDAAADALAASAGAAAGAPPPAWLLPLTLLVALGAAAGALPVRTSSVAQLAVGLAVGGGLGAFVAQWAAPTLPLAAALLVALVAATGTACTCFALNAPQPRGYDGPAPPMAMELLHPMFFTHLGLVALTLAGSYALPAVAPVGRALAQVTCLVACGSNVMLAAALKASEPEPEAPSLRRQAGGRGAAAAAALRHPYAGVCGGAAAAAVALALAEVAMRGGAVGMAAPLLTPLLLLSYDPTGGTSRYAAPAVACTGALAASLAVRALWRLALVDNHSAGAGAGVGALERLAAAAAEAAAASAAEWSANGPATPFELGLALCALPSTWLFERHLLAGGKRATRLAIALAMPLNALPIVAARAPEARTLGVVGLAGAVWHLAGTGAVARAGKHFL